MIQKLKTIQFAAFFVAAIMAVTPASGQAGPQQASIVSEGLTAAISDNIEGLKADASNRIAALSFPERGSQAFPALATVARTDLQTPALDNMSTGMLQRAVFSSVALPIRNLPAASQWHSINTQLEQTLTSECKDLACQARASRLKIAINKARSVHFIEQLRLVNLTVNKMINYSSDRDIHGRLDYWATPSQTLQAGRGDCEDYAILKMAALVRAGIPLSSMSLVVLRDRKRDLFHAVLAVTTDQGHFILDNAHDTVLLDSQITRYQPLFSMTGERYWLHGTRRSGDPVVATGPDSLRNIAPGEGADVLAVVAPLLH